MGTVSSNDLSKNEGDQVKMYSSQLTLEFGQGAGKFTLYFTNNTNAPYNAPGCASISALYLQAGSSSTCGRSTSPST